VFDCVHIHNFEITQRYGQHKSNRVNVYGAGVNLAGATDTRQVLGTAGLRVTGCMQILELQRRQAATCKMPAEPETGR
jgi:hypothetical protein